GTFDGLRDAPRTTIVGSNREIPVAKFVIQVMKMVSGGAGGFFGIEPLIGIRRLLQAVLVAAKLDELPEAFGGGAGNGAGQKTGFGLGEMNQFLRDALFGENP